MTALLVGGAAPVPGVPGPAAHRSGLRGYGPRGRTASRCRPGCGPQASVVPGLLAVAAATSLALLTSAVVPGLHAPTVAVALGVVAANTGLHRPVLRPGTHVASHRLLRLAVVLLGLQLGLPQLAGLGVRGLGVVVLTVAVTFTGTLLLGRLLRVPPARALLVATGFSICGASAVAAMEEVAGGDEDDTAVAVALVTLCGSLAIVLLPLLQGPLGLDAAAFGSWVGASVHDVGQTVATASAVPGALTAAVVVKLSRVVLLAPLVAGVALHRRRATGPGEGSARPPLLPLFVVGFLGAIALTSTGLLPGGLLDAAGQVQGVVLTAALVGLGTAVHLPTLRRTGPSALVLGLSSWLLVGSVAYAGVVLLG